MKKPITLIQALRSSDFQYLSETTLRFVLLFVLVIGYSWAAQSQPYCTMVCNDNLNVSLGRNCEATITYDMILEDPDNSYHCLPNGRTAFVVQIMTTQEGVPIPTSPTVTSDYVGQTLYVKVKHWDTGNSCSSTIFIEDKQVPLLNCPDDVTLACTASTEPSTTGFAMATDCSDFSVTYEDEVRDLNCGNITSQINRTWKARDIYGNERSCVQRINIQRPNINAVSFPANRDNVSASAISCTDGDTTPSNTGTPLFNGQAVTNEGSCKFTVNYNDELISGCEGSFKILRRWIVIDHCTSLSREHTQLIKVEDDNAPQLVCPQSMTVGANGFECSASVILPEATVTDACSNTISVQTKTPAGTIDGNGGVISSLPAGTHSIIYEATDACGNVGSCELIVSVIDNVKPAMVCEDLIKVTLTNNGTATIAATVFDDGTRDNCCADVNFEVRRMDEPDTAFAPTITFDCADAATEVQVVLRGTDCNGNAGICMVMAEIEDKSGPAISCPATTTIYCTDDASDLDLTGEPTGFDACGLGAVSFSDETFLNDCNTGYILRTFTIDDDNSNAPASCVQRINIIDTATVSVVFPPDYTTSNCGSASDLQPDDLPEPFNRPTTAGEGCGLLAINFTDEVFTVAPPACFKILRTWTVINWCEYDPNNPNGPGRYEEIQVIKVLDNDAPTFDCPSALTFDITGADCTTTIELPALSNVDDCSGDINIQVSGDLGSGTTFTDVAPGTYAFTYTVSDGCGNAASCEVTATVRDTKPPTSYCNNGIVATLMPTGMVDVWAVDLNAGSFDNCTEQDDLQFRISASGGAPGDVPNTTALTFTCENLGTNAVRVWVGDQKGNWSFCETFVQVQDPNEACSGFTGGASIVAGLITNTYGEAIEGVEININGQGALAPTYTDVDGRFRFEHVEAGADYTISPNKRINTRNGVTTFDQVLIQKHILELEK
ncbi:MAG: HYR domain-containing protein, partial [Bacteroidota bacterium]